MKVEYTIATKGVHGGYSNIKERFKNMKELQEFLKIRKGNNDFKIIKTTWINNKTCKEEEIVNLRKDFI